jgi:hypothetical protein
VSISIFFGSEEVFVAEGSHGVSGCNASRIRLGWQQRQYRHTTADGRQRIGDQIKAAMIFTRADFVNVGANKRLLDDPPKDI